MPVSMTDVTCTCGKTFKARRADVARGWGQYCSKSCAKKRQKARAKPRKARPVFRVECRECGDTGMIGSDGLCDHCAYMNSPLMGWDDHK